MDNSLHTPTTRELFAGFFTIGLTGFGGVLPLAHRMMVLQRRWLSEAEFAEVLGLGQLLPGPNIVNVAVAVGARFHGARGSLVAVGGLLLAPMIIILLLGMLYGQYRHVPLVQQVIQGLASAAAGLVMAMCLRMMVNLERRSWSVMVLLLTFVGIAILHLPLLWVLLLMLPLTLGLAWLTRQRAAQ
jgi:chromate transporter